MAKAAQSDQLRAAFEKHYEETEGQIERLEQIFQMLGKPACGKKCDAASSMKARKSWTNINAPPPSMQGLLAAAQAAEHYEISRYGTLKTRAGNLRSSSSMRP